MLYELAGRGLQVGYNTPFTVLYKGNMVGEYFKTAGLNGWCCDAGRFLHCYCPDLDIIVLVTLLC